jgi:uncharacterized protein
MRALQRQTWNDLLFMHWPVPAAALRRAVPAAVPLDTFDGTAWLGVTPFAVSGVRPPGLPPLPRLPSFLETNVRTYVTCGGRPAIWFLSLDAQSRLAVAGARAAYRLPYFHADMAAERHGPEIAYRTRRRSGPAATLRLRYGPAGDAFRAAPGTLEHFLVERYRLCTTGRSGRLLRADIAHPPWSLRVAEALVEENTMAAPYGIELSGAPLLHLAARQDVAIGPPRRG